MVPVANMLPVEPYNSNAFLLLSSWMQKKVSTVAVAPFSNESIVVALSSLA